MNLRAIELWMFVKDKDFTRSAAPRCPMRCLSQAVKLFAVVATQDLTPHPRLTPASSFLKSALTLMFSPYAPWDLLDPKKEIG